MIDDDPQPGPPVQTAIHRLGRRQQTRFLGRLGSGEEPVRQRVRLPLTPDLAVIATPPKTVPGIIHQLGERGTKAAVVITAGLNETLPDGSSVKQTMLDAARPHLLRIIGPNCLGVLVPGIGLNASFAHIDPLPGKLAFVAQSGAVVTSVIDWATTRGIGFSHLVALGDMSDVDFGDMLDYLANDPGTSAILLYIEAITDAWKFMSAGRAATRMKPVVIPKVRVRPPPIRVPLPASMPPTTPPSAVPACSGSSSWKSWTLAMVKPPDGDRLAIITNGGGVGVMATDALIDHAGQLAKLDPRTIGELDKHLPPTWSKTNPVDIIGDAPPERFKHAVNAVMNDPNVDAILAINCPTAIASPTEAGEAVIQAVGDRRRRPVFTSWLGDGAALEARRAFAEHGMPTFETPEDAVSAFMQLVAYRCNQKTLMETPAAMSEELTPDLAAVRSVIEPALKTGRVWLTEPEAKQLLATYDIPVAKTIKAATPREAAKMAAGSRSKSFPRTSSTRAISAASPSIFTARSMWKRRRKPCWSGCGQPTQMQVSSALPCNR